MQIHEMKTLLSNWLKRNLEEDAFNALAERFASVASTAEEWEIFLHFSSIHRWVPKEPLNLPKKELEALPESVRDWQPNRWELDQIARARLLLSIAHRGKETFLSLLEKLFESSDMREGETLYKSLAILPWPESLTGRASEGVRSNITTYFRAVAHHNPYPAQWLDQNAWNQMVLKALFMGEPLYRIVGLDQRRNTELATMCLDLAEERWAAGRDLSPEIWRLLVAWEGDPLPLQWDRLLASQQPLHLRGLALLARENERLRIPDDIQHHFPNPQSDESDWDALGLALEQDRNR